MILTPTEERVFDYFEELLPEWDSMPEEVFYDAVEFVKSLSSEQISKAKKEKPFHGYNPKKHARTGGLNAAGRAKAKREEGANLKPPVTEKNPTGKKKARKKSFCARMRGVKGPTSKEGKLTPKGASLKRWRCSKSINKSEEGHFDASFKSALKDWMQQDWVKEELEKGKNRCWEGYKPTPGKKPYAPKSCMKKSSMLNYIRKFLTSKGSKKRKVVRDKTVAFGVRG